MPDTKADPKVPHINRAVLDARCAELGATTDEARAGLIGVDRATLWRWSTGAKKPSLDNIRKACTVTGLNLDELFPAPGAYLIQSVDEAAAKVAANWPALTDAQKDALAQIFAPILYAERSKAQVPAPRRAA